MRGVNHTTIYPNFDFKFIENFVHVLTTKEPDIQIPTCILLFKIIKYNNFYYVNTNEVPVELLRENLIYSHVKISPCTQSNLCLSHKKKNNNLSELFHYFIGVYIINRTLHHGQLEIRNICSY